MNTHEEIERLYQQAIEIFHESPPKFNISFCIKVWTQLAEQYQHAGSMAYLSRCYKYGIGVYCNDTTYLSYTSKSANLGNQYAKGICYSNAINCTRSYKKSMECYELCIKNKTEESLAFCAMGFMYENGFHVPKDLHQAFLLYKKSADLGCVIGIANLALCAKSGKGISANLANAATWYKMAADKAERDSQYNYALLLQEGKGIERDLTLSLKYFTAAANSYQKNALEHLIEWYFNGSSEFKISRDYKIALYFLKLSERNGLTGKMALYLGQIYYFGLGCTIDYTIAFIYFHKSIVAFSDYSNPKRHYFRGICYFFGFGHTRDYAKAAADLKSFISNYAVYKSHEYVDARVKLGYIYEYGKLGERDIKKAIELYREAAIYDGIIAQNNFIRLMKISY